MTAYSIGKWCIGREEKKKGEAQLLLRLANRTNYAPKFPPESPLIVWPLFQLKRMKREQCAEAPGIVL